MELEDPETSTCCLTTQVSQRGSADAQQSADMAALCQEGRTERVAGEPKTKNKKVGKWEVNHHVGQMWGGGATSSR